jgi:uncharacterized membrane protein
LSEPDRPSAAAGAKLVRSNLTEEQDQQLKHAFGAKKHTK